MVLLPAALLALSVLPAVAVAVAAPFALPQTTDQCPTCTDLTTDLKSCSVTNADLNSGLTVSQWACLCEKSGFASTAATCLTCLGTPTTEADMQSNCVPSVSSQSASSVSPSRATTPTGSANRTSTSASQSTSRATSATPGSSTTSGATGTSLTSPSGSGLRTTTGTGDAVANNIPGAAVPIFVAALIYQLVWGF